MNIKMRLRVNLKMIIFEKSNPSLTFAKWWFWLSSWLSIFVILSNPALMPNSLQSPSSTTMAPLPHTSTPPQLCHHLLSLLPCPLLHQLMPPTAANQLQPVQITSKWQQVVWVLGFFFWVLFFALQLTNVFICFFYVIYHEMVPRWLTHTHATAMSTCLCKWATGMAKMGRAQQWKRRGATMTMTMGTRGWRLMTRTTTTGWQQGQGWGWTTTQHNRNGSSTWQGWGWGWDKNRKHRWQIWHCMMRGTKRAQEMLMMSLGP